MKRALLLILAASPALAADDDLIGTTIKSDSWNILRKPHIVETYSGKVRYAKDDRSLGADWARFDHGSGLCEARGKVTGRQLLKDGAALLVEGHEGRHSRKDGIGGLWGKSPDELVSFKILSAAGAPLAHGSAKRLEWDYARHSLSAVGDAEFNEPRGSARAGRADYDHAARVLTLRERRPVAVGSEKDWSAAVQADEIEAADLGQGRRRVSGKGSAKGWINFNGSRRGLYR